MTRPLIGVVANYFDQSRGQALPHARLNVGYFDAISRAGGLPVILPPVEDRAAIDQFIDLVDAVLFGGGYDISPRRYGHEPHPKTIPLVDRLEPFIFAVFERADLRADLPVFGVCLGAQVFNVARGGTLHQHVPDVARSGPLPHHHEQTQYSGGREFHPVRVVPGSRLAQSLGGGVELQVNSGHHQAVDRLGRGLRVCGRSPDGIVEAVEDPERPFFVAVQWHPEEMFDRPEHLALFQALVRAADVRRDARSYNGAAGRAAL